MVSAQQSTNLRDQIRLRQLYLKCKARYGSCEKHTLYSKSEYHHLKWSAVFVRVLGLNMLVPTKLIVKQQ